MRHIFFLGEDKNIDMYMFFANILYLIPNADKVITCHCIVV